MWPRRSATPRPARCSSGSTRPASSTRRSAGARSTTDKLVGNLRALIEALNKAKPASSKGIYLRKVALSSSMGVGARVDLTSINARPHRPEREKSGAWGAAADELVGWPVGKAAQAIEDRWCGPRGRLRGSARSVARQADGDPAAKNEVPFRRSLNREAEARRALEAAIGTT
jgi:hypothetical protein